jgi:Flp pilus assembly protein TadG
MVNVRKRKGNRRRGAAAVEAALVLPILLLVSFGALQYGWVYLKAQQITNAARYGARVAIRADASTQDVIDAVAALLGPNGAKLNEAGEDPNVAFRVNGVSCPDISSADDVGDAITVIVMVSRDKTDLLNIPLFPIPKKQLLDEDGNVVLDGDGNEVLVPKDIGASVTMAKEGF